MTEIRAVVSTHPSVNKLTKEIVKFVKTEIKKTKIEEKSPDEVISLNGLFSKTLSGICDSATVYSQIMLAVQEKPDFIKLRAELDTKYGRYLGIKESMESPERVDIFLSVARY